MLVWKKQIKKLIIKKRSAAKNFARPSKGEAEGGGVGGEFRLARAEAKSRRPARPVRKLFSKLHKKYLTFRR